MCICAKSRPYTHKPSSVCIYGKKYWCVPSTQLSQTFPGPSSQKGCCDGLASEQHVKGSGSCSLGQVFYQHNPRFIQKYKPRNDWHTSPPVGGDECQRSAHLCRECTGAYLVVARSRHRFGVTVTLSTVAFTISVTVVVLRWMQLTQSREKRNTTSLCR